MSYKRILKWLAVCMGMLLLISIALYVYGSKKKLKEEEKLKLEEIAEKQAKGMKMEQLIFQIYQTVSLKADASMASAMHYHLVQMHLVWSMIPKL